MGNLSGHVAIVTGAARQRGIGRAVALRLAAEGAAIAVSAVARAPNYFPAHERDAGWKGAQSVADEIKASGGRAIAVDCDVTKRADVEKLIGATMTEFGQINALVNNAGVASEAGAASILEMDDALWQRTLDINLTGTYLPSKLAGIEMVKAGKGGAIVNLSSLAGRQGIANYGAYCTTKFGVVGFTQQLALELASHKIRVNCVAPGTTDTDMMDGTFTRTAAAVGVDMARVKAGAGRGVPLGRQGRVEEQAATIAFLIGPDASYITGQTINVDGGMRMD